MVWSKGQLSEERNLELVIHERALLYLCVSKKTSSDPRRWTESNPAYGQSLVIALLIQHFFGGEVLCASLENVPGYEKLERHYWNQLSDGSEVDLSAKQFQDGFRDLVPNGDVVSVEYLLSDSCVERRYAMVYDKYHTVLKVILETRVYTERFVIGRRPA